MAESRLFRIIYYLMDKGQATTAELAERFEVSPRTILRDIDALSGAGIPVYTESGRNGGIRLMDGYVLQKAALSEEERREILLALNSLSVMGNNAETLNKLAALFNMEPESWLEIDFSSWGTNRGDGKLFEELRRAITRRKRVRITYNGINGATERVVEPLKLIFKSSAWYLGAFCLVRNDFRFFKLTRISDFEVLEESFEPKAFPERPKEVEAPTAQLAIRFSPQAAFRVYDEFPASAIERQPDGSLIVTVTHGAAEDWLKGYLLGFGARAEVLEPKYLREQIAAEARKIFEKYDTGCHDLNDKL